ncbi:MAG: hypothetical protein Q9165_006934, partial [Trypethelium subeluteriae]
MKADPAIANHHKETFTPPDNLKIQEEITTWFGLPNHPSNVSTFQDYGSFATLMANSATSEPVSYPQLISFMGSVGVGKSTLVKMLINQQQDHDNATSTGLFPTPIPGSTQNGCMSFSRDVHLFADPATYLGPCPLLYADCEGLESIEEPNFLRDIEYLQKRSPYGSDGYHNDMKKLSKMVRGSKRGIAWANSSETKKLHYVANELYPRL